MRRPHHETAQRFETALRPFAHDIKTPFIARKILEQCPHDVVADVAEPRQAQGIPLCEPPEELVSEAEWAAWQKCQGRHTRASITAATKKGM